MAINGGVKFFEKNYALLKDGASATASTNPNSINSILDVSKYTEWESIGSSDATTETITVTLNTAIQIDRILLVDFNFKEFEVKYDNGGGFVSFTNVIGMNGEAKSGLTETAYALDTGYYEFDAVTTSIIQITCLKTQVVNAQKTLTSLIVTEEIGTLQGFPRVKGSSNRNETKAKALSRKFVIQKTYETQTIDITFKTHPYAADIALIETLFDRDETFLVYAAGGRAGTQYFKYDQKQWTTKDIFNMQLVGKVKNEWEKGVYILGANKRVKFEEHI